MLTLTRPLPRAVRVPCDRCQGTGKRASEWDWRTGAVVAFRPCDSCLGGGTVLVNPPKDDG